MAAGGLIFVSQLPVSHGYPHLFAGLVVTAIGMGLVMAPATESIMGSLPKSKAGVGSAMNDTTRQMGGALGVAVIGSLFASAYRPGVGAALAGTGATPGFIAAAKDSLGSALNAAGTTPRAAGRASDLDRAARVRRCDGRRTPARCGGAAGRGRDRVRLPPGARPCHDSGRNRRGGRGEEVSAVEEPALEGLASLTFAEAEGMLELDANTASGQVPQAERRTG